MKTPAQQLLGMTLDGGWKVIQDLPRHPTGTGGNFSHGYIVENGRTRAFLKALDYSSALRARDPAPLLRAMTEAYIFERQVLQRCRDKRLDRVVVALDDGTVRVAGEPVQYLILELAETDARALARVRTLDLALTLRSLHHVATGIAQLHRETIAHQDVKPSNVLAFDGGTLSKLGDLGRAAYEGHSPPHDACTIRGDPAYAPPELLYGHIDPDWKRRHFGCDAYLLGSMVVFFFTGVGSTALLGKELNPAHLWTRWHDTFSAVLPYVRDAFGRVVDFVKGRIPKEVRPNIVTSIRELCEPDPALRGHPLNRLGHRDQFSMERYVTLFDLLARRAELGLLKK